MRGAGGCSRRGSLWPRSGGVPAAVMPDAGPFAREVEGLARSGGIFAEFLEKPSTSWAVRADGVSAALSLRGLQAMCRMSTVAQSFAEGGEAVIRGRGRGRHSPKGQGRHSPKKWTRPSNRPPRQQAYPCPPVYSRYLISMPWRRTMSRNFWLHPRR